MRTALVGVTLLGLLALAAAGSAGGEWGGGLEERNVPGAFVDYAFTFGVLIVLLLAAVVVWAFTGESDGRKPERPRRMGIAGYAVVVVALIVYFAYTDRKPRAVGEPEQGGVAQTSSTGSGAGTVSDRSPDNPEFQWWVALGVALAIGAIVANEWRRRPQPDGSGAADELEAVLTETLGELELDPDPRRAVIQAYVRMEGVLGAHGHARLPHEAPLEYLARVLRELDVRAEAAHALTELFERARFSHHEIDAAMRAEAVASLEAVRDDLRAAA
ncbi:MAG: DUF4129 domain-containing protein [Actinomycetota bacterium]